MFSNECKIDLYLFGSSGLIAGSIAGAVNKFLTRKFIRFSRSSPDSRDCFNDPSRQQICVDLRRTDQVSKIIAEIYDTTATNVFIFSAWQGTPRDSDEIAQRASAANERLVETYMMLASTFKPSKILVCSSSGALSQNNVLLTEEDGILACSEYASKKLLLEKKLSLICRSVGVALSILRVSTVTGFLPKPTGQGLIAEWSHQIALNRPIKLVVNSMSTINFISDACLTPIFSHFIYGLDTGIYNVASLNSVSLDEVIEAFEFSARRRLNISYEGDLRLRTSLIDISKLRSVYKGSLLFDVRREVSMVYSSVSALYE